jgi:hypothetical protein
MKHIQSFPDAAITIEQKATKPINRKVRKDFREVRKGFLCALCG